MLLFFKLFHIHNNIYNINYNYSLHMQLVFTQDWQNSFWIPLPAPSHLLYCRVKSLINALLGQYLCLREISINVNKCFIVILYFDIVVPSVLFLHAYLFISFYMLMFLLLVYFFIPLFYTDVVAIFLFIRWSRNKCHYFDSWSFCLSF